MVAMEKNEKKGEHEDTLHEFLLVLRRALLLIVKWIEKKYQINDSQ
jgi:hypothetical protein